MKELDQFIELMEAAKKGELKLQESDDPTTHVSTGLQVVLDNAAAPP